MKDFISVIIPIYNVEQYLPQCINSVLNQTYTKLEIILVDDGSPDNCGKISDEYAQKDSRIKVVHKKNAGLGEARNTGLEVATGEYIYFIDSDDWIEPNMLYTLLEEMENENADFVMCGFKKCAEGLDPVMDRHTESKQTFSKKQVMEQLLFPMIAQKSDVREDYTINMCVWTNLYKRSIIETHHIRFLSEREYLSEDICFNLEYLKYTKHAVLLPDTFYCYRYNPTSLTSRYKGAEYDMLVRLYAEVCKIVDQIQIEDEPEFRKQRFFLTKTREVLFRLANSNFSLKKRIKICGKILSDNTLQTVLSEYPMKNYAKKYKIPAILMQKKLAWATVMLFYFTKKLRKR